MSLSHNLPDYWSSHVKANVKHYTRKKDRPGTVIAGCPANYGQHLIASKSFSRYLPSLLAIPEERDGFREQ